MLMAALVEQTRRFDFLLRHLQVRGVALVTRGNSKIAVMLPTFHAG
jgi:hypothetical protein